MIKTQSRRRHRRRAGVIVAALVAKQYSAESARDATDLPSTATARVLP